MIKRERRTHQEKIAALIAPYDAQLADKDREFAQMVASKDSEHGIKMQESAEAYRSMVISKDSEREEALAPYTEILGWIQFRAFELSKDIRRFCAEVGSIPTLNQDDGEDTVDFLKRLQELRRPWHDKVTFSYATDFSGRIDQVCLEFAKVGQRDFKLEQAAKIVSNTEQLNEIANRISALALRELSSRVLHDATLKQLCCD